MGAEVEWMVVYELPTQEADTFYGVTSQEAMQVCVDNGPIGARPLFAYRTDEPFVKYSWNGDNR